MFLELKDDFPDMDSSLITVPNASVMEEDLLSVTSGAQNFSTEATFSGLLPDVPFEIMNGDTQENSPTVLITSSRDRAKVEAS